MEFIADLHTHTVASTHAYSTVTEIAKAAEEKGLCAVGITDHGPDTPDSPHIYHFLNMEVLPKKIGNVTVLKGMEANVLDNTGKTDVDDYPEVINTLDLIIASMHYPALKFGLGAEYYTGAWLNVIKKPYIDILGHLGDERFFCDYERIIKAATEAGKVIEINNNSFKIRPGAAENCLEIAKLCVKYDCRVCVNSDAHYHGGVAKFSAAEELVRRVEIPKKNIINASVKNLSDYFNGRKGRNKIVF